MLVGNENVPAAAKFELLRKVVLMLTKALVTLISQVQYMAVIGSSELESLFANLALI